MVGIRTEERGTCRRPPNISWAGLLLCVASCGGRAGGDTRAPRQPGAAQVLVVYNAGSLAQPVKAVLDSFARHAGITIDQENAGSVETTRKLTDLHEIPDLIALADESLFRTRLMPQYTSWYVRFARNHMTIAYTARSKLATAITPANWYEILQKPGVEVGRADPQRDPNGYQTLLTLKLAEQYYHRPGLSDALVRAAPPRNVRPKETDLVALLQTGELDYIWSYASIAREDNLEAVPLPPEIDLGTPEDSARYAAATVVVRGSTGDSTVYHGQPIIYGLSVPTGAPHPALAVQAAAYLLSDDGRRILRAAHLETIDHPQLVGISAPSTISSLAR